MAVEGENAGMGISLEISVLAKNADGRRQTSYFAIEPKQSIDPADTHNYLFSVFPFPVDEPHWYRILGGIPTILPWWPIKPYRPCPNFIERGGRYVRSGQALDEIAFGRDSTYKPDGE
jgi:hypothetical protein